MEYTISQLAKLAGISTRTLRYYDEIDLLKPKRIIALAIGYMVKKKWTDYNKFYFFES